jgi:hypothetical protein
MIISTEIINTIKCDQCGEKYNITYSNGRRIGGGVVIIPLKLQNREDLHFDKKECALSYMDSYLDGMIAELRR